MTTAVANSEDALLLENLDLVRIVRVRHFFWWRDADELEQIGRIALWELIRKDETLRQFRTYAYSWIRFEMLHHISTECKRAKRQIHSSALTENGELPESDLFPDQQTPLASLLESEAAHEKGRQLSGVTEAMGRMPEHRKRVLTMFANDKLHLRKDSEPDELSLSGTVTRIIDALAAEMICPGAGSSCPKSLDHTPEEFTRREMKAGSGVAWTKTRERSPEELEAIRQQIRKLKAKGWFHDEIAKRLCISIDLVREVAAKNETGGVQLSQQHVFRS